MTAAGVAGGVAGAQPAAVLVMARAPVPGRVKTRLEPLLGAAGCARLQEALIRRTARWAAEVAPARAFVAHDPPQGWAALAPLVPAGVDGFPQVPGHLGSRLADAAATTWERAGESGPLLVVGVDTRLTADHATAALTALANGADVVFGPALDGGYYLAGLARPLPEVFAIDPAAWGGAEVLRRSVAAAEAAGLRVATIATERDLDTPDDARAMVGDPEVGELLATALARAASP